MVAIPTLIFEAGFVSSPTMLDYLFLDDLARGILDTNTLAPDVLFSDITSFLHEAKTDRTSSRLGGPLLRYEAGQLSARLNNTDRRFDPTNLNGPYASAAGTSPLYPDSGLFPTSSLFPSSTSSGAASTQVTPMRAIRLRATWAGVTYDVWRGFADSWLPGYYKGDNYSDCVLVATDGFKVLAAYDRPAVSSVGNGETTGTRIGRVLDSASWPTHDRIVSNGDSTVQGTTLEGVALSEAQLIAETEIGEFYIDEAGRAFFRGRHGLLEDTRSNTSQATFGDAAGELQYFDIEPSYDEDQLVNHARVTRVGGTEQVAQDVTSRGSYLTHTHTPTSDLPLTSDTAALDYARYIVNLAKDPQYRFESLTINPLRNPTSLFPHVLGRRIGDRITVKRRPPGGGTIQRDVYIAGVSHDIAVVPELRWLTTWQLHPADMNSYLILDHSTLGKLDSYVLAY